jgi:hypothetical protein
MAGNPCKKESRRFLHKGCWSWVVFLKAGRQLCADGFLQSSAILMGRSGQVGGPEVCSETRGGDFDEVYALVHQFTSPMFAVVASK